jgi:hypothetical protein
MREFRENCFVGGPSNFLQRLRLLYSSAALRQFLGVSESLREFLAPGFSLE